MKNGGTGGGNTKTGLIYEGKVDLATFIAAQKNYAVKGSEVLYNGECVAHIFKKYALCHCKQYNVYFRSQNSTWGR